MPPSLATVMLYALVPVVTTAAGAVYAALRPPSAELRSLIQHFAAGVVFSVVAVELLPDVTRVHDPFEIGWTFAAGLALMLLISSASPSDPRAPRPTASRKPWSGRRR